MSRCRAYAHRMYRSRTRVGVGALAFGLLAAACGSSSPGPESRTTTTTTPPTTATTDPPTTTVTPRTKKPLVPTTGVYFGTWRGPGPSRPDDAQQRLAEGEQMIGRKYAIDH